MSKVVEDIRAAFVAVFSLILALIFAVVVFFPTQSEQALAAENSAGDAGAVTLTMSADNQIEQESALNMEITEVTLTLATLSSLVIITVCLRKSDTKEEYDILGLPLY